MHPRAEQFDVVVVGQGVVGLATALALARRGRRVAAVDALGPGHPLTSSTGASRSIRSAYAEPAYVRLVQQAIHGWEELEGETDRTILHLTGQVDLGPANLLDGLAKGMAAEGVEVRPLDSSTFPELRLEPGEHGLFHANGGTVRAAEGMEALAIVAERHGAELAGRERVTAIDLGDGGASVTTTSRTLRAGTVVVAAGPWSGELLAPLGIDLPLTPAVAQVTYFDLPALVGRPGIADWAIEGSGRGVYGHPVPGVGYKFAFDAAGREPWSGAVAEWPPDADEQAQVEAWVRRRFPDTPARVLESQRHPWTMTPDADWVIDSEGPLVVACGCSGHAFKFGPALGELVAGVALGVPSDDAAMFSMRREAMSLPAVDGSTPIDR